MDVDTFSSSVDVSSWNNGGEVIEHQDFMDGGKVQFQMLPVDLTIMDFVPYISQNLATIFSPFLKSAEHFCGASVSVADDINQKILFVEDDDNSADLPQLRSVDSGVNCRNSCDYLTCNVSDFLSSDMIVADLPFDGNMISDEVTDTDPFSEYLCGGQDFPFGVAERHLMLPFFEDVTTTSNGYYAEISKETTMGSDALESHLLCKDMANIPNPVWSTVLRKEVQRKPITLVLDLDETLVHSTLEHSDDADFTFQVFFNMKEQTVYVKRRPFLQTFLERAAEMFRIFVFTASQSIYAEKLLDKLDSKQEAYISTSLPRIMYFFRWQLHERLDSSGH